MDVSFEYLKYAILMVFFLWVLITILMVIFHDDSMGDYDGGYI